MAEALKGPRMPCTRQPTHVAHADDFGVGERNAMTQG